MDTIKSKYHETLAATVIKNLEKRQMEGYYCPTVEDAEKLAFSFLKDGQTAPPSRTLKRWHSLSLPRAAQYLSAAP